MEPKRKSIKLESSKPNTILRKTPTKLDTKPDVVNLKTDSDAKVGTTLSNERDLEKLLLDSPSVKSSAHSGIIFIPKKKLLPVKNIFNLHKDGSSNDDQSSNILPQPCLEDPKPARKTLQYKDASNEAAEKKRTSRAPSLIPVKKAEGKMEQKRKSVKLESSKPNTILTSTKLDTKRNVRNYSTKDSDAKVGTTLAKEIFQEKVLLDSPSAKSSAHSGIIFVPKKKLLPGRNIFNLHKDGSSNDDQSPNILHQPCLENPKTARKTQQYKDATNEAAEKISSGRQSVAPTKKKVTARTDKATSSKMPRSKTEAIISTNPRPSKPLHKVQSFSRLKPQPLIREPAHQAILDLPAFVKKESKVAVPTSAHGGVPFKPKKPSTFPAVNIFAERKDDTSK